MPYQSHVTAVAIASLAKQRGMFTGFVYSQKNIELNNIAEAGIKSDTHRAIETYVKVK